MLDVTALDRPPAEDARRALKDARNLYVVRTYAFGHGGHEGLGIVDIEKPEPSRCSTPGGASSTPDEHPRSA